MKLRFWRRERKPEATALGEIVRHFNAAAADEEHFPSTIDPRIFHVQLILHEFGGLGGKLVLDVGSGKGRFARILHQRDAAVRIVACDLAEAMLRFVPAGIERCAGSMTSLPFPDDTFDYAYATESLEHAVDIEGAVREMCRVVRSGGKLVIIDKNVANGVGSKRRHGSSGFVPRISKRCSSDIAERQEVSQFPIGRMSLRMGFLWRGSLLNNWTCQPIRRSQ